MSRNTSDSTTRRAKVLAAYNTADTLRQRLAAMQRVQHAPADAAVLREAIALKSAREQA